MNNLIGAADYSIVCRSAIWSMVLHSDGIQWQSKRLDNLSSRTITQERSQERTWQAWLWTHNLVSSKLVALQIVALQQPHLLWEVDQKLGDKSPPVQVTLNLSMMSYRLIKARAKQCPTTLRKEDQGMALLENRKERLISWDETKVMITHDHAQYVTVQQEDWTTKTPGMNYSRQQNRLDVWEFWIVHWIYILIKWLNFWKYSDI